MNTTRRLGAVVVVARIGQKGKSRIVLATYQGLIVRRDVMKVRIAKHLTSQWQMTVHVVCTRLITLAMPQTRPRINQIVGAS
jgi:RNA-binding protein YhbY